MDIVAKIGGGVCGLSTMVRASSPNGMNVSLTIESDCPKVRAMAADMPSLDAFEELLRKSVVETIPLLLSVKHKLHSSCLVPVGVLKTVEAAAGLALPCQCAIELTRVE